MAKKHLVIVESPAKAKTIGKYLGKDYEVKASMGHLRDLPKSCLLYTSSARRDSSFFDALSSVIGSLPSVCLSQ